MAYSPLEVREIDQIRGRLGDTQDPPKLRGGETRYQTILDQAESNVELAGRIAAARLAAQIASEPDSLSDTGSSISWKERIPQLNRIAAGLDVVVPTTTTPTTPTTSSASLAAPSGDVDSQVVW